MKKQMLLPVLLAVLTLVLSGCFCSHESWLDADCTTPRTCESCGRTEGESAGHDWQAAACETPKTCARCGLTEGEALGHTWLEAACEAPRTCDICHQTEGEALGHRWLPATTEQPQTCDSCGKTTGERIITDPRFTTAANEPLFGIWEGSLPIPASTLGMGVGIHGEVLEMNYQVIFNNDGTMRISRVPADPEAFIRTMAAAEAEKIYRLFEYDGYTRAEAEAAIQKTYAMTMEEYVAGQMGDVDVEGLFQAQDRLLVYYLEGETLHCAADWSGKMSSHSCVVGQGTLELSLDGAPSGIFTPITE